MICHRLFTILALSLTLTTSLVAQEDKTIEPCRATSRGFTLCSQVDALAVVNGQNLTLLDIDSQARKAVQELDSELARVRREALASHINGMLLEKAVQERKMTLEQLYNSEIAALVVAPTEEQIKAEYEAHPEQYGALDFAVVRNFIAGALRDRQERKLLEGWVARQSEKTPVIRSADINDPSLKPGTILATVDGRKVTLDSLNERLKPRLYDARLKTYELVKDALNRAINDLLLKAEAKRRSLTPKDLLRIEITEKVRRPTDEEITKFYRENSWRFKGALPAAGQQVVNYIEQEQREQLENKFYHQLRAGATLRVMLPEPERPVQQIDTGRSPSRGDARAPITVIAFGDFQCRPCGKMHTIAEEAIKPYGNSVRLVFREFPLSMHPRAYQAAEAALAAHAQGKFWEYASLLFNNQNALDTESLKKYASEVGLDRELFDKALHSRLYSADVRRDMLEGELYGVTGTPAFFINGVRLPDSDYSLEGIRKAIDAALTKTGRS